MSTKLICLDMDGVIFKDTNFWMRLHQQLRTLEKGKKLTQQYLHTNYNKLVQEVVTKLWKGKDATPYFDLIQKMPYLPGVREFFAEIKKKDILTAIITASSIDLARKAQHDFGIDFIYANELVIKNNKITGEFIWPIGSGHVKKAQIIRHLCQDLGIRLDQVLFIGDSDTDVDAFQIVGKSVAFNCKDPDLKKRATYVVNSNNLKKILLLID